VTGQAGFGRGFSVEMLGIYDLGLVATAFHVGLARSVARFTPLDLVFPSFKIPEFGVFCARKRFELVLVARRTCFAANIIVSRFGRHGWGR